MQIGNREDDYFYLETNGFYDSEYDDSPHDESNFPTNFEVFQYHELPLYQPEYYRNPKIGFVIFGSVGLILLFLIAFFLNLVQDSKKYSGSVSHTTSNVPNLSPTLTPSKKNEEPDAIVAPYEEFVISQGLHDMAFGHMAIDIVGGKGATIQSPIDGVITDKYVDGIGNTTLVIENDYYQVTLLHGEYIVDVGEKISLGQTLGYESNFGNTFDSYGNSCRGRDCGYHTHLNIYDKILATNVNPLELLGIQ